MAEGLLHLTVRTPHAVVLEARLDSLRVPTESGQVGLRPRAERSLLVVEPGLVVAHRGTSPRFLATAGGLLHHRGTEATLFTPIAVVGEGAEEVLQAMERAQAEPDEDREVRHQLGRLEQRILDELRGQRTGATGPGRRKT
jgi:F0F1-type ATP synthase epsilon subunit